MKFILHLISVIFLTVTTQIGGIIYLLSGIINKIVKVKNRYYRFLTFVVLYLFITFLVVPKLAPFWGREKITNNQYVENHFLLTALCNRNYVKPKLNQLLQITGKQLQKKYPNLQLVYLDANFPFINGFPLLPHLSHSDGKKIDISFIYIDKKKVSNKKPTISGYGVFEKPRSSEYNQTSACKQKGYWQYDFPKYLTFGTYNKDLKLSLNATRYLLNEILQKTIVQKIFIEPHLKNRLNLHHSKIRFHGCQAVRHDDHIHFQIK